MGASVFEFRQAVLPVEDAKPFDLDINEGECWFLGGPPRAGISTILKVCLGLLNLKQGHFSIQGQAIDDMSYSDLLAFRKRCGVVMEADGLIESWTAYDNVALPLRYHFGRKDHEIENQIVSVAGRLDLEFELFSTKVADLSPLERRVTSIIRALLFKPRVMVFDAYEPVFADKNDLNLQLIKLISRRVPTILVKASPTCWSLWEKESKNVLWLDEGSVRYAGNIKNLPPVELFEAGH